MTTIYLIRHAEAEGNFYRRIQGWHDGGITARGRLQIDALAERFRDIHIDALYSSDLIRTMTTAGAITKYHALELNTDARLREINLGVWEDLPWGNAAFDRPEQLFLFNNDPEKFKIPGSEGFSHLQSRISGVLLELSSKHENQTIAVVSHGMAIRSLISLIKGLPSERVPEILHGDNTCVAKLLVENGKFEIEYYNDNSHLPPSISTFAGQEWWKTKEVADSANLRIIPLDPDKDAAVYKNSYADSWQAAHGSLKGFDADTYLRSARRMASKDPHTLMKALINGTDFAGIVELDNERGASSGAGWISFFYLIPELRGHGYAPQLLGHAVSFFRNEERKALRLNVAVTNIKAIRFYKRSGFERIGVNKGVGSDLLLMEMKL